MRSSVVPRRALVWRSGRQTVYLVGKGDSVAARDVVARAWVKDQWLIERGLASGDRVIVDGTGSVAPGMLVKPVSLAASFGPRPVATSARAADDERP